jgi:hypothetical protein
MPGNSGSILKFFKQSTLLAGVIMIISLAACDSGAHQMVATIPATFILDGPSVTPSSIAGASTTPSPTTLILTPTPSLTTKPPTITPLAFGTLSPQGPYLLFQKYHGFKTGQSSFVVLDIALKGRKTFELPDGGYVWVLSSAVSPDGRWLAYHTGSVDFDHKDLVLHLFNLQDGTYHTISRLLSDDYPENFKVLGELLVETNPERFSPEWDWEGPAKWNFPNSILRVGWSPDGRYLTFAGQMDGLSADIYIYDTETKSIDRVTESLLHDGPTDWSPDGEWIGILSAIPGLNYQGTQFQVVPFHDHSIGTPRIYDSGTWAVGVGWIQQGIYFLHDLPDGCCGPFNLRYVDVRTGQRTVIWTRSVVDFAFDPEHQIFAVSDVEGEAPGLYFVDLKGTETKVSDETFQLLAFRGGLSSRFLGFNGEDVTGIAMDGQLTIISDKPFHSASISPDRKWYVLHSVPDYLDPDNVGLDLFSDNDQFVRQIWDRDSLPIWRPDSQGLFFISGNLYYVAIPDGEPVLVDDCEVYDCWYRMEDFVWLP